MKKTRTVLSLLAPALLMGSAVVSATSASAAVRPLDSTPTSCTASNPEVCMGADYSGSTVYWLQMQVHVTSAGTVCEVISGPAGHWNGPCYTMSGAGWTSPPFKVTINGYITPGTYCGNATFNGTPVTNACVYVG